MQIQTKLSIMALCLISLFAVLCLFQKNNNDNTTTKQSLRRSLLGTIMHPMQQQQGGLIDPQSIVYKQQPTLTIATTDDIDIPEYSWNGVAIYYDTAKSLIPITDKVTTHTYQIMYGKFLLPYYSRNPTMKMLEIGLGCNMGYGPGASVALYRKLFPQAEIWEAEYDGECVESIRGQLDGINTLVGDQGNDAVLDSWIEQSGGNFDVVIDDGGHQNCQIWHSFQKLWPTVKSGGLYFIEDMQVAKHGGYRKATTETCDRNLLVPEKLKEVFDDLMYDRKRKSDIEFMFCQSEACVLGKK